MSPLTVCIASYSNPWYWGLLCLLVVVTTEVRGAVRGNATATALPSSGCHLSIFFGDVNHEFVPGSAHYDNQYGSAPQSGELAGHVYCDQCTSLRRSLAWGRFSQMVWKSERRCASSGPIQSPLRVNPLAPLLSIVSTFSSTSAMVHRPPPERTRKRGETKIREDHGMVPGPGLY